MYIIILFYYFIMATNLLYKIVVDDRERVLINNIKFDIIVKRLELGDIEFYINNILHIIFERKTINDLADSIKDGRYKQQKRKLLEYIKDNNIQLIYIIEGEIPKNKSIIKIRGLKYSSIDGSILNMIIRDKIYIIYTLDINDTINILIKLTKNISKYIQKQNNEVEDNIVYYQKNTQINKKNIDIQTCFIAQLSQIPSISLKKAKIIAYKYKTYKNMINKLTKYENPYIKLNKLNIGKKTCNTLLKYLGFLGD